jgi:hypothetical protein
MIKVQKVLGEPPETDEKIEKEAKKKDRKK